MRIKLATNMPIKIRKKIKMKMKMEIKMEIKMKITEKHKETGQYKDPEARK